MVDIPMDIRYDIYKPGRNESAECLRGIHRGVTPIKL